MIHFKLFILAIATVFFINEVGSLFLGSRYHDWKDKSLYSAKVEKLGFKSVALYNTQHHSEYMLNKVLKAKSKNNGTKYYDLTLLVYRKCRGGKVCITKLHCLASMDPKNKDKTKIEVDKMAE
uniref:Cystatin domain-containing protein n=1 Tax=Strongyloides stercoralis TaxID=6248 RepID=A0A0K0EEX6_STRER